MRFELPLIPYRTKPTIRLYDVRVLIDTGSSIPMMDLPESVIMNEFGGRLIAENQLTSGIGGDGKPNKLYRLKHFDVGGLDFVNIPFELADLRKFGIDILLPSSMFGQDSVLTIDRRNDVLIIDVTEMAYHAKCLWRRDAKGWHPYDYVEGKGWTNLAAIPFHETC